MKTMSLTEIFVNLARSRTPQERLGVIRKASQMGRFDEEQRQELQKLGSEIDHAGMVPLRPVSNATQKCEFLEKIEAGPDPILTQKVEAEVHEWATGWKHAMELVLNGHCPPGPLLLHGPTGSGKTTICGSLEKLTGREVMAAECHRMLDSHMGESGSRLAKAFKAVESSGSVLVFEEIDGLALDRSKGGPDGASQENIRVTIALMRLMEQAKFPIVATTNRIDVLDSALLRRFEYKIEVPTMPDEIRIKIISSIIGGPVPKELDGVPLNEALPMARRIARNAYLKTIV